MEIIEIIAVLFSLASVILTVKNNIWCWPIGIIGIIFYMILFGENQIWGNMYLQAIFICQSILGWYNWKKPSKYPIKYVALHDRLSIFGLTVILTMIISLIMMKIGGRMPYFDGLTTSLSIMAMILLAYRKIENWIYWIIADVIFIWFFYVNELYLSSGIYSIFLLLSISGLLKWRKSIRVD